MPASRTTIEQINDRERCAHAVVGCCQPLQPPTLACAELRWAFDCAREAVNELNAHKCGLPDSINQALNSGDGVYRP